MNKFIDHYKDENVATKYSSGRVFKYNNEFVIGYETAGAEETFSVGQPVYDKDNNLMGYTGIGLYENLDYSTERQLRIPVEHWTICLPTQYCVAGKSVYTYWQSVEGSKQQLESGVE